MTRHAPPTRRSVLGGVALLALAPRALAQAPTAEPFALIPPDAAARLKGLAATAPKDAPAALAFQAQMVAYAIRGARRSADRKPQPLPVVHTEGTLPHQGIYDVSLEAKRDWPAALDLALGARLTGEAALAEKAAAFIKAWLGVYKPSFNPIDETDLERLMLAYDLLEPAARGPIAADWAKFLRALATGYLDRMPALKGGTATNNWQSHRVKLAALAAFGVGDKALIERARAAFAKQLADNFRPDGSVLDFAERDALHYVTYDLEPLLAAALAAKTHGGDGDWYGVKNPAKIGLREALLWLQPYAEGKIAHEDYVHSTVAFDAARAKAGVAGFAGRWERGGAEATYTLAARLGPAFKPLAEALTPGFTGDKRPGNPWLHLTLPV